MKGKLCILIAILMIASPCFGGWKATYDQLTSPASSDAVLILDESDVSTYSTGEQKYLEYSDLITSIESDADIVFDDTDNNWTATTLGDALEELDNVINSGLPNATTGKVDWSQLVNVPSGFADGTDSTGAGGAAITFDIGDDGGDDSTDVNEIATSGDTNSIFTEPTADKILIDLSQNWPTADAVPASGITGAFNADSVINTAVYSGTTSLEETTGATDSGAYIIGVYDEFAGSSSTNVQDVLDDLDALIAGKQDELTDEASLYSTLSDVTQFYESGDNITFTDQDNSPSSVGELTYDNIVTGLEDGALAWYDDDSVRYIVDLSTAPSTDDYIIAYDATNDEFYMKADSGGAGSVDTSGTPVDNDWAKFTDSNTVEGRSNAETVSDLSASMTDIESDGTLSTDSVSGNEIDFTAVTVESFTTSLTSGSIPFSDGTNLTEDNANLFWDDTNDRLGLRTATPDKPLTIQQPGDSSGIKLFGYDDQSTDYFEMYFDVGPFISGSGNYIYLPDYGIHLYDDNNIRLGTGADYFFGYDSGNTQFEFLTTDGDGGGTDATIFRIDDGTDDIVFPSGNLNVSTGELQEGGNAVFTTGDGALNEDNLTNNTLDDLSDVNTATVTAGNVLRADGVDFESTTLQLDDLGDVTGTGNANYLLQDDGDGTYSFTNSLTVDIILSDGTPTTDGLLAKTTSDQLALGVGGTSTNYFSPTKDVADGLGDSDVHTISEALANDSFEPLDATIAKTGANEIVTGDWEFEGTAQIEKILTQLKNANENLDSDDMGTSIRDNDDAANNTYTLPSVGATDDGMRITLTKLGSNNPSFAASDSDTIGDSSSTNAELTTYGATLTIEYCDADTVWLIISAYGTINLS